MKSELLKLKNVGKATYQDLLKLGIHSIAKLAQADPDELYLRLQEITGHQQDPCVWDVFAAIIHEAQTGIRQPWWAWTPLRKKRQINGVFLSQQKIILRPITVYDTDWFIKIYNNPIIMRDIYDGSTLSRDAAIDRVNHFLQNWQTQQFGVWMIIEKDDPSKIIGYCVFRFFEKNNPILDGQIELGYILDQPFWGKGYATQAVKRCIEIGFELHHFNRILSTILPQNIASQKVVLKAGMKHINDLPVKNLIHQIYEINKGEYTQNEN